MRIRWVAGLVFVAALVAACKTPAAKIGGCCGGFDRAARTVPAGA